MVLGAAAPGLVPLPAAGQSVLTELHADPGAEDGDFFALPFAFSSDVFGFAVGAVVGGRGLWQEQTVFAGTAVASTNASFAGYLYAENFKLPWGERLFVSPRLSIARLGELESYRDGNPEFPLERAGSNDSDEDNFLEDDGSDEWYRIVFKYVLPLGHGRDAAISRYTLDRGLLVDGASGATSWNPLRSGKTVLELEPFYREQDIDLDDQPGVPLESGRLETGGVTVRFRHENVDFLPNPSTGSVKQLRVTWDPGISGHDSSYLVWEIDWSKYFDLGESDWFRQQVLALNFWMADTPSWKETGIGATRTVDHRPPNFVGATLGGSERFRGYPTNRFSDKAAILYTAELRMIPHWNPLGEIQWLKRFVRVDWWQIVPFVEIGRVSPHWHLETFHEDLKWSAGIGIRGFVNGLIIRADTAFSEEELKIQMMVSQPFPAL